MSTPVRTHADDWVFPACPHTGPRIALDHARIHAVWFSGKTGAAGVLYYANAAQSDLSFGEPVTLLQADQLPAAHLALMKRGDDVLVAYALNAQGQRELTLARVGSDGKVVQKSVDGTQGADHPTLIESGDRAVVAWTEKRGEGSIVRLGAVR